MWLAAPIYSTGSTNCTIRLIEKPPTVLDSFILPGLSMKVYTMFFLKDTLVAAKTDSWATHAAGTMSAAMVGSAAGGSQGFVIGSLMDHFNSNRGAITQLNLQVTSPDEMVAVDKANFQILYSCISYVEIKGPNLAGEVYIKLRADKEYKFRVDNQSKDSAKYIVGVFHEFLPGKSYPKINPSNIF